MDRVPVTSAEYRRGVRPPNAGKTYPPETYTPGEIRQLLDACRRGAAGDRDSALYWLLWRSGLRIAEALALYPRDVDLAAGTIRVAHGKGDRYRIVGIDASAHPAIERWLERRRKLGLTGRHPLFCRIRRPDVGRQLETARVRDALRVLAAKTTIEKRVHAHGFRHTFASEAAYEGVPLAVIQAQLGHSSIVTTARYIAKIAPAALVRTIQAREAPQLVTVPDVAPDVGAQLAAIEAALAEIRAQHASGPPLIAA